ncbi:MAG TPA: GspE/PulE family protein [Xanthomonadaceae bacterium]
MNKFVEARRTASVHPSAALPKDFVAAWQEARRQLGLPEEDMVRAVADFLGVPVADLASLDPGALRHLPEAYARERFVLPLRSEGGVLHAAMADPGDPDAAAHLRFGSGLAIAIGFASPEAIEERINFAHGEAADIAAGELLSLDSHASDAHLDPIVRVANAMLRKAVELDASDVHIQPHLGGGIVRMRVDGLLRRVMTLPKNVAMHVIRHFLAVGGMDPVGMHLPQDGRYQVFVDGRRYDLRLSMAPARGGATLVIRMLDQSRSFSLGQLGFSTADRNGLQRAVARTSGLLLLTGPTGCGKTSTLYALLAGLNRPEVSIATVEDPVEYEVAGLAQTEVNEKRGLSFEIAIRALMRQDPNVILIGEIRDAASASAAARAALTGHLVLSTLHTNTARTALSRLADLGVSEEVLGEIVIAIAAQRLVRTLCQACAQPIEAAQRPAEQLFLELCDELPAKRAVGCEACGYSGYKGRLPLVEIYEPSAEDRTALLASRYGTRGETEGHENVMAQDALEMIVSGLTTIEEAERALGYSFWSGLALARGRPLPAGHGLASSLFGDHDGRPGVLLVDVAEASCPGLAAAIGEGGFAVHAAKTLDEARDMLHRVPSIYLLLVDLRDGGDAGARLLRTARESLAWSGLPAVVLVPAGASTKSASLSDHRLAKPVEAAQVVEALRRAMA